MTKKGRTKINEDSTKIKNDKKYKYVIGICSATLDSGGGCNRPSESFSGFFNKSMAASAAFRASVTFLACFRGGCNRLPPHNYLRMGRIVVEGRTSKYDGALHSDCDVSAMRGKNEGEE